MRKIIVLVLGILSLTSSRATAQKAKAYVGADLVSSYLWRGSRYEDFSIQPSVGVEYKGLSFSVWSNQGLVKDPFRELDLLLLYQFKGFTIGVNDYWIDDREHPYFNYAAHNTSHTFEVNVGYDWGVVSLNWFTNFAGFDGVTTKGKRAYTSYFELKAPFSFATLDWEATLGGVPYSAAGGYYEANSSDFAIVNVALMASKEIKVGKSFALPVYAQLMANPSTKNLFFMMGLSIGFTSK